MNNSVVSRNNVHIAGAGATTMVFAHGFGCDQRMWRFVAPEFSKRYRTILFDYVGSGDSNIGAYDSLRYGSIDGYSDDLLEVCDALDIRDAVFVGHSFSGMVGINAAIREPDRFSRLVLVCPNARFLNDPPGYIGGFERNDIIELLALMDRNMVSWANFLAPVAMKNDDRPELTEELTATFCAGDPYILRHFAEVVFFGDHRHFLPRCPVPALILQCQEDAIAPLSSGAFIHNALPGSTLRIMSAHGHCPHLSDPDETIHLINDYLKTALRTSDA